MPAPTPGALRRIVFQIEAKEFDAAVKRFATAYKGRAENNLKRIGLEALRRTILRTIRVDTGRMRNGWHVSFHRPSPWMPPDGPGAGNAPKPEPGMDMNVKTLFLQNNVFYAPEHEFGTKTVSPLLMLTTSVRELRQEMTKFISEGLEPEWNKEINGVTGRGLTAAEKVRVADFKKKFSSGGGGRQRRRTR